MDTARLERISGDEWRIRPHGKMRVPGVIYATEALIRDMDEKVYDQVTNVASLPGIVKASFAMPDAHWGYGFPIGGVAAFDPDESGVISAGGVGFDISCGVRTLGTGMNRAGIERVKTRLADALFRSIPAGVGSTGRISLNPKEMDDMLRGGAQWALGRGWGRPEDVERIESLGRIVGALPEKVSNEAKRRQKDQMGTLGSGNHYLELQEVTDVFEETIAAHYGLRKGDILVSIHCGSRGLGHQVGTDYLKQMVETAARHGIDVPDRELACAPIESHVGRDYLGAMRAAANCALANRQIIMHLVRETFAEVAPGAKLALLYDVSHNICRVEEHEANGRRRPLYVHRKGATCALGPGHPYIAPALRDVGQPVLIGGTMGTESYILAGTAESMTRAYGSSCHGAGRRMSRHQAMRQWGGRQVVDDLRKQGIEVRTRSLRGVAEEAPGAYKDVSEVVEAADRAGLSKRVARVVPVICVKG
jgi:tRNA-splicing ligase RtcB (3'-phosphate/5'-hydroxy nucleic acid ligase)